jgi:hypothetical protein
MQQTVKRLPRPENHDYQAAEDYENTDIPCILI